MNSRRRPYSLEQILRVGSGDVFPRVNPLGLTLGEREFIGERAKMMSLGLQDELDDGSGTSPHANWIPELPQDLERQVDMESRMPEADFVPETVTDPALRMHMKKAMLARARESVILRRSDAQWGGQLSGLVPPGSPLLTQSHFVSGSNQPTGTAFTTQGNVLQWNSAADAPEAVNLQLSYTVDNRGAPSQSLNTDDISLYGKVEWGGGSANQVAYCDFGNGTQLRLTASYVRVSALYLPNNLPTGWPRNPVPFLEGGGVAPTGPTLTASAILGRGFPSFRTSSARFTRKWALAHGLGPGASLINDPIPYFAGAFGLAFLSVLGNPPVDVDVYLNTSATDVSGFPLQPGASYGFKVTNPTPIADNTYMVPQGCKYITLVNNGANDLNVAIIYSLLL